MTIPTVESVRVGIYKHVKDADKAVHDLIAAGFTQEEIGVVCSDKPKEWFFRDVITTEPTGSHTAQSAVTGGVVGMTIGGLFLAATTVVTGGFNLLAASSALISGAMGGTFLGAMLSRGFEKEIADYYDRAIQDGQILVSVEVHGDNSTERLALADQVFAAAGVLPEPLTEAPLDKPATATIPDPAIPPTIPYASPVVVTPNVT